MKSKKRKRVFKMEKVVITGYKDMEFKNGEGANEQTVNFIKLSMLTKNSGMDAIGYLPTQVTYMDEEKEAIQKCIKEVPAVYEAQYEMVPGKNNKPTLKLTGYKFIKIIDIAQFFA